MGIKWEIYNLSMSCEDSEDSDLGFWDIDGNNSDRLMCFLIRGFTASTILCVTVI